MKVVTIGFFSALSLQAVIRKQGAGACIACDVRLGTAHMPGCPIDALNEAIEDVDGAKPPNPPAPQPKKKSNRGGYRPGAGRKSEAEKRAQRNKRDRERRAQRSKVKIKVRKPRKPKTARKTPKAAAKTAAAPTQAPQDGESPMANAS
jgi:hypothetical protein